METALYFLTSLAIILLIGLFCTFLSNRLKIPYILLLLISGLTLGSITYKGEMLIKFPASVLTAISILALVMIIFDSASRYQLKQFDTLSPQAIKL